MNMLQDSSLSVKGFEVLKQSEFSNTRRFVIPYFGLQSEKN